MRLVGSICRLQLTILLRFDVRKPVPHKLGKHSSLLLKHALLKLELNKTRPEQGLANVRNCCGLVLPTWQLKSNRLAADEDEDSKAEEKPKTKKETVWDWELLNESKPIWLRQPSEVSEEDYTKFYKSLTQAWPKELESLC